MIVQTGQMFWESVFLKIGMLCFHSVSISQNSIEYLRNAESFRNRIEAYHDMDIIYERQRRKMHHCKNTLQQCRIWFIMEIHNMH